MQDHLDLRAVREQRRQDVAGADGVVRGRVETGHSCGLGIVSGRVRASRLAYRAPEVTNLYPADAVLNLPVGNSHGLRRLAAVESLRGSFESAADTVERVSGVRIGKRQMEQLSRAAADDVEAFYAARRPGRQPAGRLLVMSLMARHCHDPRHAA